MVSKMAKKSKQLDEKKYGGEEVYTPDIGSVGPFYCRTCGDQMSKEPGINGYRSWASAMGKQKSTFDYYECPNRNSNWHIQVLRLKKEISETASTAIGKILQKEINQILKNRKATKVVSRLF